MSLPKQEFLELLLLSQKLIKQAQEESPFITLTAHTHQTLQAWKKQKTSQEPPQTKTVTSYSTPPPPLHKQTRPRAPIPQRPRIVPKSPKKKLEERKEQPEKDENSPLLTLFPFEAPPPDRLTDVISTIRAHFPAIDIRETPPDDSLARQVSTQWERASGVPNIALLSYKESPLEREFLNNVAKAISRQITSASVLSAIEIEHKEKWKDLLSASNLQLLITEEDEMKSLPILMKHHRLNTRDSRHYLAKTPVLLLSSVSSYLRDPSLKSALWNAICQFTKELR